MLFFLVNKFLVSSMGLAVTVNQLAFIVVAVAR